MAALSFADMVALVRSRWQWPALGLVLGITVSVAIIRVLPPWFESRVTIRAAKLSNEKVYSTTFLQHLYRNPRSFNDTMISACGMQEEALAGTLRLMALSDDSYLEVAIKSDAPERAHQCLQSIAQGIIDVQNQRLSLLAEPMLKRIETLKSTHRNLEERISEFENLAIVWARGDQKDQGFHFFAKLILDQYVDRERVLAEKIQEYEAKLAVPNYTQSTYASPILVPIRPAGPSKALYAGAGGIFGLAVGALAALAVGLFRTGRSVQDNGAC